MTQAPLRIAVVGAGIIGLSVARSLSLLNAQVSIFERTHLGAGTSSKTFAWINSNGKNPDSYHALNCAGMREHVALQESEQAEARWLDVCGTYEWAADLLQQERLGARALGLQARDYPAARISRTALQGRIPELRIHPRSGDIWHFPSEAVLCPSLLLARLWSEARQHGATLHEGVDVLDIDERPDGVTLQLSEGKPWSGDYVVLATGRWTPALTASLGVTLAMIDANQPDKRACGFLGLTAALYVRLRANLITPEMNVRPDGGGRLLLQTPDLDDRADPAYQASTDGLIGQEMLARLRRTFHNTAHARLDNLSVGQRSRPADGLPAVGFITPRQRAYVVATHSGMTLGPMLGRLVAQELVEEKRDALLKDYQPDRLLNKSVSDFVPIATLHYPAAQ